MKKNLFILLLLISVQIKPAVSQTFSLLSSGCNNLVYTIAGDASSGNIFAGGVFDHAGGNTASHIAKWNGSAWSPLDNGMTSPVRSLVFFNNELYAGGDFITAGSAATTVWMVTKWNGSSWVALGNGLHGAGVYSLAVYQSELYAGGFFDTVYTPGKAIAKWNGSSWVALGTGQNNGVFGAPGYKVKVMKNFNGKLWVGGTFTTAGGITVNNIARWDGAAWSAVGTGTNGDVNAFAVYNGELYVGGNFTIAGGVTVNHIAKISGTTYSAVGAGTNGTVNGLAVYQNNLFVTGSFTTSGSQTTQNLSRWNGTNWFFLPGGIGGIDGPGHCLAPFNGNLLVGGLFGVAGPLTSANSIVSWNMPPTGIEDVHTTADRFIAFPNPSSGKFQIQLTGSIPEKFDLYVTDVSGRDIYYQKFENYLMRNQIDITPFKSGMYFLKIVSENSVLSTKIIIE